MSQQETENLAPVSDDDKWKLLRQVAREVAQQSAATTPPSTGPTIEDALQWSVGGGGAARYQQFQDAYARNVAAGAPLVPHSADPEPKSPSDAMLDTWTSPEFFDELKNVAERAGPGV